MKLENSQCLYRPDRNLELDLIDDNGIRSSIRVKVDYDTAHSLVRNLWNIINDLEPEPEKEDPVKEADAAVAKKADEIKAVKEKKTHAKSA